MDARTRKMQRKVAKLLRQAESVVGTPEEAVFHARAFELMAKYGIELATIEQARRGLDASAKIPDAIKWTVMIDGKYVPQQGLLLFGLIQILHCELVYYPYPEQYVVHVYGARRHIHRIQALWEILQPQAVRLVETARPPGNPTAGETRRYRRSWVAGFAARVRERLEEQEVKAIESADAAGALVIYDDDARRALSRRQKDYPGRLRKAGPLTSYSSAGYAHGQRDGSAAAMNRSLNH
ncbi:DUF2786 domain-containing protein [Gordonia sputi]|uniref:DUF2786 domain-containing protein n=1 Tax=Gordonia sputi TaxID=36823 RepID=UPI00369989B1